MEPERIQAARERAGMSEPQGIEHVQDMLPGMEDEYCEFGCFPIDHGEFEWGETGWHPDPGGNPEGTG